MKSKAKTRLRGLLRGMEHALACAGLLFLVYHAFFDLSVVCSPSMAPTLQGTNMNQGDWVLNERLSFWIRDPQRWDVVSFYDEEGVKVMKRVVGFAGETLSLYKHELFVNGKRTPRPAHLSSLKYYSYGNLAAHRKVEIEAGYYVLGDSSRDAHDSRFVGPIQERQIRGRALCIVWPLSRARWIHP